MKSNKKNNQYNDHSCNLISILIVNELQKNNSNVLAQIYTTWVNKFFVINGITDSVNTLDIGLLINTYFESIDEGHHPINVIDLIDYGNNYKINQTYTFNNQSSLFYVNENRLTEESSIEEGKPYTSDKFYGLSLKSGKELELLSAKIAYHTLSANYTNQVTVSVDYNDEIYVHSKNWVVKESFAKNVIEACFSDRIEEEITKMDLINFDFTKLLNGEGQYPWMVRDHIKDFTMI
tara:strand:+ start:342 stop:1046 length:705 start_codon:yes stop_codon:yes gene_type:complete